MYKIILINPIFEGSVVNYLPTGLCYITSYLKKYSSFDLEIKILNISPKNVDRIKVANPDLVGFTAYTHTYKLIIELAKSIRNALPNIKIAIGGPHITTAPRSMDSIFDFAVIGEGEKAFLKLLESLIEVNDFKKLPGIQYFENGEIQSNPKAPMIDPLDKIPFPDRNCVEDIESVITSDHVGWFNIDKVRSMQVTTSRGCPFKCIFCQPSMMWENFRMHSPEYVAEEIELIHNSFGINAILIEDDFFSANKKRISDLIDLLAKRNIIGKIRYYVAARTAQIDEDWVKLFNNLGVEKVEFGIESGSDKIASYLKNSKESMAVNKRAIGMLNEAGISVFAAFIAGSPPEKISDLKKTFQMIGWIKNNHPHNMAGINIATPLPGTGLWDYAVQKGLIETEGFDWDKLSTRKSIPWSADNIVYLNENIPPQKLIRMIKLANLKMYIGSPREFFQALPRRMKKLIGKVTN